MKKIPWWDPQIGPHELGLVKEVLESGYINEGDVADRFEKEVARLLGVKHAVATTSGTAAIFLGLAGMGVGHGDEVLVPDFTFIATANAVKLAGGTPVMVDIDPKTLCVSVAALERAITKNTKAIAPVHVTGHGADMEAIVALAKKHGLAVVEDAAEAFFSKHAGKHLGTWGDAGAFSFSPNKTITSGQGGMVVTNDDALVVRLRQLKDQGRPVRGTGGDDLHPALGFNFKLTNLQAAVGLAQLRYLEERASRQRRIHQLYAEGLRGVAGLEILPFDIAGGALPLWTDALCDRRDALESFLREHGAGSRKFWHPIHTQAPYKASDDLFPHTVAASKRALWLPSAYTLTDDDVRTVIGLIKKFYEEKRS